MSGERGRDGQDASGEVTHDVQREQIGAYALGHLDRREAQRLRRHIAGCPECRADLAEIVPVAQQLERLSPSGAGPEQDRRAGGGRRRVWAARTAVLVAAVAVGILGVQAVGGDDEQVSAVPVESVDLRATDDAGRASVSEAGLIDHTWGVELVMTGSGFVAGEVYRVRFLSTDGDWAPAGRFVGTGGEGLDCGMQSGLLRRDAVAVQVLDGQDQPVLSAEL